MSHLSAFQLHHLNNRIFNRILIIHISLLMKGVSKIIRQISMKIIYLLISLKDSNKN